MYLVKLIFMGIFAFSMLSFSGCQSGNSNESLPESNVTNPPTDVAPPEDNVTQDIAKLTIINGNELTVTSSGQQKDINIVAFNANSSTDTVGEIAFQYPADFINSGVDLGYITPNKASVVDGIAHFTYTAPADLQAREDANYTGADFKFYDVNNPDVTTTLHVDFNSTQESVAVGGEVLKTLILSQSNVSVYGDNETKSVNITAFTDQSTTNINTQLEVRYPTQTIEKHIDIGTIEPVINIVNGKATFTYTAPDNVKNTLAELQAAGLGDTVTLTLINIETGVSSDFNVTFKVENPILKVDATDAKVTITQDGQQVDITVLAFDSNNQPYSYGSIMVVYPDEVVNGTVLGGSFAQSEVALVNGRATFTYTAPNSLADLVDLTSGLNFSFVYKENEAVSTTLTMQYKPVLPTVILPIKISELTLYSQVVNIAVDVYDSNNNLYEGGNVKVVYPEVIRNGCNVGSFASSSVAVENGVANFTYTAPSFFDQNDTNCFASATDANFTFSFYHEDNPQAKKEYILTVNPDENQTILRTYKLYGSFSDGNVTMDLESSKLISFYVKDDNGDFVSDDNMTSIVVTLLNPNLGYIDDNGTAKSSVTKNNQNNITISFASQRTSGIVPVKVDTTFTDVNGDTQTLSEVYNIIILSGPPSAMSLSYAGTEIDENRAKFIEKWVLTVTDRYNNPVSSNPAVSMGMMAGFATSTPTNSSHGDNYLFYRTTDGNGTLDSNDTFTYDSGVFGSVNPDDDYLVTFGDGYTYNASGKWDINTTSDDNKTLNLLDDFDGNQTSPLGFAVGHNYRQDMCADGVEWVGNVYPESGSYVIDDTGSMRLNVEYDYYMVGKAVMLWVNLVGQQNSNNTTVRIGEAKKVTLRGQGLVGDTYSFSAGFEGVVRLYVNIKNTVEQLKNAHFGYAVTVQSDDANWTNLGSSTENNGITYCYGDDNQNGAVYVDVNFTSETPNEGTVSLTNVLVGSEF